MSFAEFFQSIVSDDLKAVATHWNEARGERAVPTWEQIRPSAIQKQLPIIWSYRFDVERDDFMGRLAGNAITQIAGAQFKDAWMSDLRPPQLFPRALARTKRVITEPSFYRGLGLVYMTPSKKYYGERIAMPLANEAMTCEGVFGATEFHAFPTYYPKDASGDQEAEFWFALD
jgi:hypothetical protein